MNLATKLLENPWLFYNHQPNGQVALAYENSFIRYLPLAIKQEKLKPGTKILHWYPLVKPTVLLGYKDTRLPQFEEALRFLKAQGYECVVRPHGGLAVVNDSGVINLSIIQASEDSPLSIDFAYQQMIDFLRLTLADFNLPIENYQMAHSYCPGTYDINIHQRKIGGTAQRRFKNSITTAIYLSVSGNQEQRAELLKEFYRLGHGDLTYPDIIPESMASLADHTEKEIHPDDIQRLIIQQLNQHEDITEGNFDNSLLQRIFQEAYSQIKVL